MLQSESGNLQFNSSDLNLVGASVGNLGGPVFPNMNLMSNAFYSFPNAAGHFNPTVAAHTPTGTFYNFQPQNLTNIVGKNDLGVSLPVSTTAAVPSAAPSINQSIAINTSESGALNNAVGVLSSPGLNNAAGLLNSPTGINNAALAAFFASQQQQGLTLEQIQAQAAQALALSNTAQNLGSTTHENINNGGSNNVTVNGLGEQGSSQNLSVSASSVTETHDTGIGTQDDQGGTIITPRVNLGLSPNGGASKQARTHIPAASSQTPRSNKPRTFHCVECANTYTRADHLTRHYKRKHIHPPPEITDSPEAVKHYSASQLRLYNGGKERKPEGPKQFFCMLCETGG